MAETTIICPHCQQELSIDEQYFGIEVECPECHNNFIIEKPAMQIQNPVASPEIPPAADVKNCPACGGIIKAQALFCKHCKSDLNKIMPPPPAKDSFFIFICPECGTVAELPESAEDNEYECLRCCETSIAKPAEERICPFCNKEIKIKATICKYCRKKVPPLLPHKKNLIPSLSKLKNLNKIDLKKELHSLTKKAKTFYRNHQKICIAAAIFLILILITVIVLVAMDGSSSANTPVLNSYSSQSSSSGSYQPQESKISVSVTVKKGGYYSWDSHWEYNCEFKLYANDQMVATRNSTSMSVTFNVKVEKGATLRAEMLPKNVFGGIAETLEGPNWNKTATASYDGESITIECGY